MDNNINFTGINNIIPKTKSRIIGTLGSTNSSTIKDVTLSMKLNNTDGKDLREFYSVLDRSSSYHRMQCFNNNTPDKLEIFCSNTKSNNKNSSFKSGSSFNVNGHTIFFDEDSILPLFTFLAKITRKIAQKEEISTENRDVARFINSKIQEEAEKYFNAIV